MEVVGEHAERVLGRVRAHSLPDVRRHKGLRSARLAMRWARAPAGSPRSSQGLPPLWLQRGNQSGGSPLRAEWG